MSKIAEPYVCDGPSCGKRRDSDANHWWLVRTGKDALDADVIVVEPWNSRTCDAPDTEHGCGIDCMLKLVGNAGARIVDVARAKHFEGKYFEGKEAGHDA